MIGESAVPFFATRHVDVSVEFIDSYAFNA